MDYSLWGWQRLRHDGVTLISLSHSFYNILFYYCLSQEIDYSFLCYTIRPCCLSILNVIVCIYQLQIPSPSLSFPPSPLATVNLISMPACL